MKNREMEGKTKVVILTFASIFLLIAFFMMEKCIWADLHFVSDTIEILLFYMQDQDGKEKRKERDNIP